MSKILTKLILPFASAILVFSCSNGDKYSNEKKAANQFLLMLLLHPKQMFQE